MLANDTLIFPNISSLILNPIAMVDGRYMIIYADSKNSNIILQNPFVSQGGIYIMFLEYGKVVKWEPVVLYQTSISGLKFIGIDCDIAYIGVGQTCIIMGNFTNLAVTDTFYLKIDFLSSGVVFNIELYNAQLNFPVVDYNVTSLRYGGYLFSEQGTNTENHLMYDYITNGSETYAWDLPNPIITNYASVWIILNNNTLVLSLPEGIQNWSLISTELFKFEKEWGKLMREKMKVKKFFLTFFKYYMNL